MEYNKIKTRLKDKLTKEYKKTQHTEEYLSIEKTYKKTREDSKALEQEMCNLADVFSSGTVYGHLTSGLITGFEKMKETLKRGQKTKNEPGRDEPDVFGVFSGCAMNMSENTRGKVSEEYRSLSHALRRVTSARIQFKTSIQHCLEMLKDLKEKSKAIDNERVKLLDLRQMIESSKNQQEEDQLKTEFKDKSSEIYDEMLKFCESSELLEIAEGITVGLKNFFGDSFDAMSGEDIGNKR